MLFNSLEFLLFYPTVLLVFWALALTPAWTLRKLVLLGASYLFYISWNPPFVLLLMFSTALDFVAARRMHAAATRGGRRAWLLASLVGNLGVLAYFKYAAFAAASFAALVETPLVDPAFFNVILPLGISFYTFQSLSYTIDVYRGAIPPHPSLLDFALYVAFFPQLVAGPIVRAAYFLPQLARPTGIGGTATERALMLIALGLFKKVVCADVLGEYVDEVFAHVWRYRGINLLVAAYAYAFQIYFDFSGYSDMAIGLAGLLGFRIPINFRMPYAAQNPVEFWRRWHISLSTWLRDYLYIPLGGNRRGRARTYVNLMLTMLLGGLWHGAAWTFVVWGAYHGVLLALHRLLFRGRVRHESALAVLGRRLATFHLVAAGFVIFRAPSLAEVGIFLRQIIEPGLATSPAFVRAVGWTVLAFAVHQLAADRRPGRVFLRTPPLVQATVYAAAAVLVFLFSPLSERFIYFQF